MKNQTVLNFLEIEKDCILKKDAALINTLHKRGYLLKMQINLVVSKCERYREVNFKFSKGNTYGELNFRLSLTA